MMYINEMEIRTETAVRLKEARKRKGLKQKEVAEWLGVAIATISGWERSANFPKIEELVSLCNLYDVSLDWLVRGEQGEEFDGVISKTEFRLVRFFRGCSDDSKIDLLTRAEDCFFKDRDV